MWVLGKLGGVGRNWPLTNFVMENAFLKTTCVAIRCYSEIWLCFVDIETRVCRLWLYSIFVIFVIVNRLSHGLWVLEPISCTLNWRHHRLLFLVCWPLMIVSSIHRIVGKRRSSYIILYLFDVIGVVRLLCILLLCIIREAIFDLVTTIPTFRRYQVIFRTTLRKHLLLKVIVVLLFLAVIIYIHYSIEFLEFVVLNSFKLFKIELFLFWRWWRD